jgi:hypothetical protein
MRQRVPPASLQPAFYMIRDGSQMAPRFPPGQCPEDNAMQLAGIHHLTAISLRPRDNLSFQTGLAQSLLPRTQRYPVRDRRLRSQLCHRLADGNARRKTGAAANVLLNSRRSCSRDAHSQGPGAGGGFGIRRKDHLVGPPGPPTDDQRAALAGPVSFISVACG